MKQNLTLAESKRKPSALLVYLALERKGRTKPMNRNEIIAEIETNFGVHIEPKTVTESAAVLKALSLPPHPIIDFRSKGKSGYLLGNLTSPLSQAEVVRLLTCFATISSEAATHAFESLRPYLSEEDATLVEKIQPRLPKNPRNPARNSQDYFVKLRTILAAFDQQKEMVFDHRYVDPKGLTLHEEKDVAIVPYNLFEKNGRFYLLGGRMGGLKIRDGARSCLYLADTENMHHIRIGAEEAKDLPIGECLHGKNFDLTRYLSQIYFVREGTFHPASEKGYLAEITTEAAYLLTKQMYGGSVEEVNKEILKPESLTMSAQVRYTVRLHLDFSALIMWSLYFAGQGRLLLDENRFDSQFLRRVLSNHAKHAYGQYLVPPKGKTITTNQ